MCVCACILPWEGYYCALVRWVLSFFHSFSYFFFEVADIILLLWINILHQTTSRRRRIRELGVCPCRLQRSLCRDNSEAAANKWGHYSSDADEASTSTSSCAKAHTSICLVYTRRRSGGGGLSWSRNKKLVPLQFAGKQFFPGNSSLT